MLMLSAVVGVGMIVLLALLSSKKTITLQYRQLGGRLLALTETVERLQQTVTKLEELSLSEDQRLGLLYDRAKPIDLTDVRGWKADQVAGLISCSYFYPSHSAVFERFQYKHGQVEDVAESEHGLTIRGFRRDTTPEDWEPFSFLASAKECTTSSCEGSIRQVW